MDDGVKDAFCPILWRHSGGAVDDSGTPLLGACGTCNGTSKTPEGEDCPACDGTGHDHNTRSRGYCTRAYDCADCKDFQYELSFVPVDEKFWLCSGCLAAAFKEARARGFRLLVPGFYSEGYCQAPECVLRGSERLGLPPRYSPFLQIVMGPLFKR